MDTAAASSEGRRATGWHPWLDARLFGLLAPLIAAGVAIVATISRQEGIPKLSTMWAEDGSVFVWCAYFDPSPLSCFVQPYAGYIHFLPRLGALLASLAPPHGLSAAVGILAALFAGFAAFIIARAILEATGSALAGLLGGVAVALVFQAGREVGGEIANLHLTYFVASVVVITTGWLRRHLGALDLSLIAIFGLSSAFAPLLVPLAIVTALLRGSRWKMLLAIVVPTALMQASIAILMPRAGAARGIVPLVDYLEGYIEVIRKGPFGGLRIPDDRLVTVGVIVVLVVLVACWLLRDQTAGVPVDRPGALRAIAVVVTCFGAGIVAFGISVFINGQANPRYAYIPTALAVEALLVGAGLAAILAPPAGGLVRRGVRLACALAVPAASLLLVVGFARSFPLITRASAGPDFVAAYGAARAACADGADKIDIRISPYPASSDWFVSIPCDRIDP